jgi:hypothetical protein
MQRNEGSPFRSHQPFVSELGLEQIAGFSGGTWQNPRLLSRAPRFYRIDDVAVRLDAVLPSHPSEDAVNRDRLTLILAGRSVGFRVSGVYR